MKLTLMQVLHLTPGLRGFARQIHPYWFFRTTLASVTLANRVWPHTRKLCRPFSAVLGERFDRRELRKRENRYLLFLRLFKDLVPAWTNWEWRHHDWVSVEGEDNLKQALQQGRGAVLISGHNYGFGRLVAPALSLRGYRVKRGGGGKKGNERIARWRHKDDLGWQYLNYKGDYWHRLEVLKSIRDALKRNEVVHISPRAYRQGAVETEIELLNRKFFLDPTWFRMIKICRVPVLPCFAIGDINGRIKIIIHRPLGASGKSMAKEFGDILIHYLTEYPEFGRMWKAISLQREHW